MKTHLRILSGFETVSYFFLQKRFMGIWWRIVGGREFWFDTKERAEGYAKRTFKKIEWHAPKSE